MPSPRLLPALIGGLIALFHALPVYSADSCRTIFADKSGFTFQHEAISDPKKLKLVENALGKQLDASEISTVLDVIHTVPAPGSEMATTDGANYQIKYILARSILPLQVFDKLYREGVLTSKPYIPSAAELQQKNRLASELGLSKLEISLIDQYSADLYYDINQSKDYHSQKRQLITAATKLPRFQGTVYRGIDVNFSAEMSVGKKIKINSFWSTSSNRKVAEDWVESGALLIIESISSRILGPFARYPSETERLFLPDSQFEVLRREGNVIFLREVL
ncbi:MAG: hypothetical protein EOP04_12845 [Proteobacteria bacterium]|nr:MAG: hypothetical protein EOP04_12845 [Pseudomonadota bacterium]